MATFLGHHLYEAAVMAQPHVQSMANSAADALKSAAEDSMGKIRGWMRCCPHPNTLDEFCIVLSPRNDGV